MHLQLKRKRLQLLGQLPELADSSELKMFLTYEGTLSDTRHVAREEIELKEGEGLWSSSSEGSSSDGDDDEAGDFETTFNRLNETSSMDRARTHASRELHKRPTF